MGIIRARPLVLSGIALALVACPAHGQRPRADAGRITVAVVRTRSATITHDYECTAYGQYYMEVWVPADGDLARVFVKEGQAVKKGDPLFEIRPRREDEAKPDDRARAASAAVGRAVTGYDGMLHLPPPGFPDNLKHEIRDGVLSIKALSDGVIVRLSRQPGHFVWKHDFLTSVVRTDVILADFRLPERDWLDSAAEWSRDPQNRRIKLILADRSEFPHAGESFRLLGGSNQDPDSYPSRATFPNPNGLPRSGRSGTVSVRREWKDAVFLPRRATFSAASGWPRYVYVVDKDHVAHRREIVTGDGTVRPRTFIIDEEPEDLLVVTKGVEAGDRIVVDGVKQVHDGDRVE